MNQNGEIKNYYQYSAFGENEVTEESCYSRLRYNSQIYDELTSQYYLRTRYYQSQIGRFTQEDILYADGLNLYAYCQNNSVMYSDPSGYAKATNGCDPKVQGENAGEYSDKIKWGIHNIDVRPEGNGFWGKRIKQKNPRVDGYELKINPNNESFYLPHPKGGYVQFENMINATVQDGKLIMKQKSFYHVDDLPDFAKNKVLQEAQRQVEAATKAGYNVEWLISDKNAAKQLKNLFKNKKMDIKITYHPE